MDITTQLTEIIENKPAGPFLFLGSGFSKRYIGLEDWEGLLTKFCKMGKPFGYYLTQADGSFPATARLIAEDFNDYWWNSPEYKESVQNNTHELVDKTSALRVEISNYLSTLGEKIAYTSEYTSEVDLLSNLNVDGIITTNWDSFTEQLFPDYKVYIGQEQLLFSNPQEIGEIYKIHGCASDPHSLLLTDNDYNNFNDRNAYLAAKLITLFIEHPIIFIGYSLSDKNIYNLLTAITKCIGSENIEKLRKNLIFVQRLKDGSEEDISDTYMAIEGVQIPIVLVKTNDYGKVYAAIDATKRKIPAKVLRLCKEQLYELVQSTEPEKKLCVVDIDNIEEQEDIEFVVGVGVAKKAAEENDIAPIGYAGIRLKELVSDLLHSDKGYEADKIAKFVIKSVSRDTANVPVFKYLQALGVTCPVTYKESGLTFDKCVNRSLDDYKSKIFAKQFANNHSDKTIQEIIAECTPENAARFIPFMDRAKIDLDVLREFLITHESKIDSTSGSSSYSYFRKLAAFYDRLKYGWS